MSCRRHLGHLGNDRFPILRSAGSGILNRHDEPMQPFNARREQSGKEMQKKKENQLQETLCVSIANDTFGQ